MRLGPVGSLAVGRPLDAGVNPRKRLARILECAEREVEPLTVVGIYEDVAYFAPSVALFDQVAKSKEVAGRFGHLLAVDPQVGAMHPCLDEWLTRRGLGLGDFVLMVREKVVDSASVQVERLSQILHRHRRALDVPARTPASPWRIPSYRAVALLPSLPKREVTDILLVVFVGRAPGAGLLMIEVDMSQLAVARELSHVEVDRPVVAFVGHALLNQLRDERYHLRNVVGRRRIHLRRLNVKLLQIGEERILVSLGVIGKRDASRIRPANGLVVDVGQVHDLPYLHSVELHDAP